MKYQFKAKRKDTGEWITGNLFIPNKMLSDTFICPDTTFADFVPGYEDGADIEELKKHGCTLGHFHPVDPDTVELIRSPTESSQPMNKKEIEKLATDFADTKHADWKDAKPINIPEDVANSWHDLRCGFIAGYTTNTSVLRAENQKLKGKEIRGDRQIVSLNHELTTSTARFQQLEHLLYKLKECYLFHVDEEGEPKTPLSEMMALWESVNAVLLSPSKGEETAG